LIAKGRFEACGGVSHRKNARRVFVPFACMSLRITLTAVFALALNAAAQPATKPLFWPVKAGPVTASYPQQMSRNFRTNGMVLPAKTSLGARRWKAAATARQ
jgi:hypothetical protein